jgi:hypothetical protein
LVQSAREFHKKFILVLKPISFVENKSDPCLLSSWNGKEVILISIYVDDWLVIGKEERIQWLIVELKRNGFNLKVESNLMNYLSCDIIEDKELNLIMIIQPHFINDLRDKFNGKILQKRSFRTPGTPRFKVIRPNQYSELIHPELQSRYRSGFGMLLYLTKYSRPDICNIARELCKCMDGATMGADLELLRVIKFIGHIWSHVGNTFYA